MRSSVARIVKVALILVAASQISGCWLIERFPVPSGGMEIRDARPEDVQTIYEGVVGHLHELGFVDQHREGSIIGHGSGEKNYWIMFELPEPDGLGIYVYIDMNPASGEVIYQYSEHMLGSDLKVPPIFSPNACKTVADINSFTAEISMVRVGADNIKFWGPQHCGSNS